MRSVPLLLTMVSLAWPGLALALEERGTSEPFDVLPHPTLPWLATQLVPSPSVAVGKGRVSFAMRWQVTPVLYSWGVNRRLTPWRFLVAEPNVRYGGSLEIFLAPEIVFARDAAFLLRPGVRAYVPLLEHGEMLSASIGASYQDVGGVQSPAGEIGVYMLFGFLGLQLSHATGRASVAQTITTLQLRYF